MKHLRAAAAAAAGDQVRKTPMTKLLQAADGGALKLPRPPKMIQLFASFSWMSLRGRARVALVVGGPAKQATGAPAAGRGEGVMRRDQLQREEGMLLFLPRRRSS